MNPFRGSISFGGGEAMELPEEGQHLAVCVGMIDLGTHIEPGFQGAPDREARKCFILFELINEQKEDGSAHVVGVEYTASLNSKSKLVGMLQKVRGKAYNDGEDVDVSAVVGKPCQVLINHKKSAAGRTYARVGDVTSAPKGTKGLKGSNMPILFIMDEESEEELEVPTEAWLPYVVGESVADKIRRSPEWKRRLGDQHATAVKRPADKTSNTNGRATRQEMDTPF
jgi:hypothetical protein